jgi:hypothetical protein
VSAGHAAKPGTRSPTPAAYRKACSPPSNAVPFADTTIAAASVLKKCHETETAVRHRKLRPRTESHVRAPQ